MFIIIWIGGIRDMQIKRKLGEGLIWVC